MGWIKLKKSRKPKKIYLLWTWLMAKEALNYRTGGYKGCINYFSRNYHHITKRQKRFRVQCSYSRRWLHTCFNSHPWEVPPPQGEFSEDEFERSLGIFQRMKPTAGIRVSGRINARAVRFHPTNKHAFFNFLKSMS